MPSKTALKRQLTPEQQQLVEAHTEVPKIVAKYMAVDLTHDEKVSAANLAMVKAAFSWREDGGAMFSTIARMAAEQAILREAKLIKFRIGGPRNPKPRAINYAVDVDKLLSSDDPAYEASRREDASRVHAAVGKLWPRARDAANHYLGGLNSIQAGEKMGLSKSTALTHLHNAFNALRKRLA